MAAIQIGYVVGSSLLVLVVTFEGAIYWVRRLQPRAFVCVARRAQTCYPYIQGLVVQGNGASRVPSAVASALHGAIFCVQLAFTVGVVQSKEDFIDTYAGTDHWHLAGCS